MRYEGLQSSVQTRSEKIIFHIILGWPKAGQDLKLCFLGEGICCMFFYREQPKVMDKFEHEMILLEGKCCMYVYREQPKVMYKFEHDI